MEPQLKKLFMYILFIPMISACIGVKPSQEDNPSLANFATPQPFTPTAVLVTTGQSPTITKIPFQTPTLKSEPKVTTHPTLQPDVASLPICSAGGQVVPRNDILDIPGVIFFQKGEYQDRGLFALAGTPLRSYQLSEDADQTIEFHGVSPDGNWIAFSQVDYAEDAVAFASPTMFLFSSQEERREIPIDVSPFSGEEGTQGYFLRFSRTGYWINNEWLYLELISVPLPGDGTMMTFIPKVFNPFNMTWHDEWFNSLPERYEIWPTRWKDKEIGVAPDLRRILYPAEKKGLILYDLQDSVVLWMDEKYDHHWGLTIRWSPDGRFVAVGFHLSPSLLLISKDGKMVMEIINEYYSANLNRFEGMAWSGDGRYLAFVTGSNLKSAPFEILVYETKRGKYLYRCPLFDLENIGGLVWSPDNQWIGIHGFDGPLRVMKVETGEVVELLEHGRIVGWSDKFQFEYP